MPIELSPKQTEANEIALSGDKDFVLYGGAMGGGKTVWGLATLIELCSEYPGSKWVVIRRDEETLKRTTIPSFNKLFAYEYPHLIASQKELEITFKNGSTIFFMPESYDRDKEFNRFRGLEINGALLEEINELQEALLSIIFTRIGRWKTSKMRRMPPPLVLATCNPSNNWVKDKIYNPWRENTLNVRWAYIPAKITDNPYLNPEYIRLVTENMPELDRLKFIEGDWDVSFAKNPFAYAYNASAHESAEAVFNPDRELFISIDFNLNPFGVIFGHIWIDRGHLYIEVFDEISIDNGNTSEMINRINALYGRHNAKFNLTGDAAGNSRSLNTPDNASNFLLLKRGLKLRDGQLKVYGNPTHSNSRSDVNWILHNASVKINPKTCPNLCRDMRFVECDSFGEIIKRNRNDPNQRADHLDCFRYAINTWCTKYIRSNKKY